MHVIRCAAVSALALILAGCGGGGSENDGGNTAEGRSSGSGSYCLGSFVNGTTSGGSTAACNNCSVQNTGASIDDSSGSYATLRFGVNGGTVTLRVNAPSGMSFPAGANSGALMRFPKGNFANVGVRFNTYSGGILVDSMQGGQQTTVGQVNGAGSDYFYGIQPSGTIDSVEVVVSLSGNSSAEDVRLYEICGDR